VLRQLVTSGAFATWTAREVAITLPLATAQAMWERARRWDLDAGGRFDADDEAMLVWSGSATGLSSATPIARFTIRWHHPTPERATIDRLMWDPAWGDGEAELRRAIEVLSGLLPAG
jgi:hypothetical protein